MIKHLEKIIQQKIKCVFYPSYWNLKTNVYTCKIQNEIISENVKLEFIGEHQNGKTNQDVEAVNFRDCTIAKVPHGLTQTFPNMKILQIHNSKLKSIEQHDLRDYKNLTTVSFTTNEIKYLPADLFAEMKDLEVISFNNNKIEIIEPNLLDGLKNLKAVNFKANSRIDKCFDSIKDTGNSTLQEIKNEIHEKFSWKKMFDERRRFEQTIEELKNTVGISDDAQDREFLSDLKKVIQNENFKDFIVEVDDEEFKVHKFLLAARSPVLMETIEKDSNAERLKLTDISNKIFREILNFMYTHEMPESNDLNYLDLYAAAGRLKIENLKNFAAEKLIDKINAENAMEILTLANKYDNDQLQQKSFEIIKNELIGFVDLKIVDLATRPEKLKKILGIKKDRDKMIKEMDLKLKMALNED